jgi:hypothetical protein
MIHVYLDDYRHCPTGFMLASNAEECILHLKESEVDVLSLDYDLGWGNKTGIDVAVWIVQNQKYPREIFLHSSSAPARLRMYDLFYQAKPAHVSLQNAPVPQERLDQIALASIK